MTYAVDVLRARLAAVGTIAAVVLVGFASSDAQLLGQVVRVIGRHPPLDETTPRARAEADLASFARGVAGQHPVFWVAPWASASWVREVIGRIMPEAVIMDAAEEIAASLSPPAAAAPGQLRLFLTDLGSGAIPSVMAGRDPLLLGPRNEVRR